jgi:hypothetical protein
MIWYLDEYTGGEGGHLIRLFIPSENTPLLSGGTSSDIYVIVIIALTVSVAVATDSN